MFPRLTIATTGRQSSPRKPQTMLPIITNSLPRSSLSLRINAAIFFRAAATAADILPTSRFSEQLHLVIGSMNL